MRSLPLFRRAPRRLALATLGIFASAVAIAVSAPGSATVQLMPASGSSANGEIEVRATSTGLHFEGRVQGLAPGVHGFHVHAVGDCSAPDAASAKGHYNPGEKPHGSHAGDLPDLTADASGVAKLSFDVAGLDLGEGVTGIGGRALVVHADPDDHVSQPAGNSGKRISCGVIRVLS